MVRDVEVKRNNRPVQCSPGIAEITNIRYIIHQLKYTYGLYQRSLLIGMLFGIHADCNQFRSHKPKCDEGRSGKV